MKTQLLLLKFSKKNFKKLKFKNYINNYYNILKYSQTKNNLFKPHKHKILNRIKLPFLKLNFYYEKNNILEQTLNLVFYVFFSKKLISASIKKRTKWERFFNKTINARLSELSNFFNIYYFFFFNNFIGFYFLKKHKKIKNELFFYYLIPTFYNNGKMSINLQNSKKKNYFFLSSGFFIKFFEKKKSFKKNKMIKYYIAKYVRKLLLILGIKKLILIVNKKPLMLLNMLNLINTPIIHKFINPLSNNLIEEPSFYKIPPFQFLYFIFRNPLSYSFNKLPLKGRIKRKILRKIIMKNKITD